MTAYRRATEFVRVMTVAGLAATLWITSPAARAQEKDAPTLGTIERLDARLDGIVPSQARVERIAEGFDWSEGPVWDRRGGFLLFSDVPLNTVFKWQAGKGVNVFLKPSGYTGTVPRGGEPGSNGLVMDAQGRLVLCQHGDRRVARLEDDGKTFKTLADRYMGKRFNSPNDGIFNSRGDLYFTDPPYGLIKLNDDPAKESYLCEAAWHHADLAVTWGKVWVKLKTHSAGGSTDKDFALARKIEDVVLWRPAPGGPLEGTPNKFVHGKK